MGTIRVRFSKKDDMKYISHLDLMRLFQRAFRRADIPVKYSQGFNPHPKFSLATALPIGVTSDGEYMDVELENDIDKDEFINKLNDVLPDGIKILSGKYIKTSKSLMSLIEWSDYIIEFYITGNISKEDVENCIGKILKKDKIYVKKVKIKNKKEIIKEVDIRSGIRNLKLLVIEGKRVIIKATLKSGSKGNLKPRYIIDVMKKIGNMEIVDDSIKIHRLELYSQKNNKLVSPLDCE
ncbi:radical SAM-linked protein [Caloranaerobacter azorensis DSM 13643]|uniref:Radical SAM-linked protein n=1 Tax=Caloranaerobacter azorensis DSM 13643 TaxID=1121264 RepID=A0A1M5S9Y4_9FIRM|nr:TIGR03936 family radical SAM-associated protein [Caloranaerobacter azorensis]SHH35291.1 radical SAM-linked protein [Caloranaerobacter azorensis DSM 13643]